MVRVVLAAGRLTGCVAQLAPSTLHHPHSTHPHARPPPQARAHGALPMRKRVHSCRRLAAFCEELAAQEEEHVLGYDYWVRWGGVLAGVWAVPLQLALGAGVGGGASPQGPPRCGCPIACRSRANPAICWLSPCCR